MRQLPFLLLLVLLAAPAMADDSLFRLGPVTAKPTGPWSVGVNIPAAAAKSANFAPDVPVPVAQLQFVAPLPVPGWLHEEDLFGSGYAVNLDGADILDAMTVKVEDGVLRIDGEQVEPMGASAAGPQQPYKADGSQKLYLLDPDSPYFTVLFYDPPVLGMQLQQRGHIPTVKKLPNPCLQVTVVEFCEGPSGPRDLVDDPSFTLDFGLGDAGPAQHVTYLWEPGACAALGQPAQWMCARTAYLPLTGKDTPLTVNTTSGSDKVFLLTRINYSLEPGVRLQTDAVVGEIWNGPIAPPTKVE